MKSRGRPVFFTATSILLGILVVVLAGFSRNLYQENKKLSVQIKENERASKIRTQQAVGQTASLSSFLDSRNSQPDGSEIFSNARVTLISEKKDFVGVDLRTMKLTLYKRGESLKTFTILSKGRDGSWWETPSGYYSALSKEKAHFSSIGKVWQPWSVQFYGNFFIHGWPYHPDGTPVPKSYSGGCVRLGTEDAKEVYDFVTKGMPIIVVDEETNATLAQALQPIQKNIAPIPEISAKALLVADLDTGEIVADKNADEVLPIASLTKLMTAVVASELIYLERSITVNSNMMRDTIQAYPLEVGKRYRSFDLLYPLLMQSSNGASRALAGFLGENYFVKQMNEKAKTRSMSDTAVVDPAGVQEGNVSTLKDLAKLSKYIFEKRYFLFNITRGKNYEIFGPNEFSEIANHNEFASEPNLLGMKNGKTEAARETMLTVWKFKDGQGVSRDIMIAVLKSEDRAADVEKLRGWLTDNFGL